MKPFCSRCGEFDPDPIRDSEGDLVYWFKIRVDDDGSEVLYEDLFSEDGEREIALVGMIMKDFEYDGSTDLICPRCAMEECPYIKDSGDSDDIGILDEDGWMNEGFDPFDDGYDEDLT